ncbi:MAG: phosphatase PAP2 family protein [Chloroflexota bacterium]|nr:phosphatase PAP2 family protein [Chloroflexota bacterium]
MNTILFLQNLGDWLIPVMRFFTSLGYEEFYLLIMPAIYWCIDTTVGGRLAIMLAMTSGLNQILKLAFHSPRPFWTSSKVRALSLETSFGFPSGHAQNAASIWGILAASVRRWWAWALAIFLVLIIGISRLYLGVHFPSDVLVGWLVGGILVWAFVRLESPTIAWLKQQSVWGKLAAILSISIAILLIGNLILWGLSDWTLPAEWIETATQAGEAPAPLSRSGITTSAGVFLGLAGGLILIDESGGFNPKGPIEKRALRYLLGIAGTLILWAGLKAIFPSGEGLMPQSLRYLRYALTGLWVTGAAPLCFRWLKLSD